MEYIIAIVAERPIKEGVQVFAELQKQCAPPPPAPTNE